MTTYNTGNPLGSAAAKDLFDNAQNFDFAINDITNAIWQDRFGRNRNTWYGLEKMATEAIAAFGYITIDSFQAGATLTLPNQVLRDTSTGEYYRWDGVFPKTVPAGSTPASAGGISIGAWLSVGDATLRSNLVNKSDESLGDALVGVKQPYVGAVGRTQHQKNAELITPSDFTSAESLISALVSSSNKIEAFNSDFVFTITVGTTGHYSNIMDAIAGAVRMRPLWKNGRGYCIINLLSGYVVNQQMAFDAAEDLSWIKITAADAVVYADTSTFTQSVRTYYVNKYLFYFKGQVSSPLFAFQLEENRSDSDVTAFLCAEGAKLNLAPYSGARKFYVGIDAYLGCDIIGLHNGSAPDPDAIATNLPAGYYLCDFSYSRFTAARFLDGCRVNLPVSKFEYCQEAAQQAVFCIYGVVANFHGSSVAYSSGSGWNIRDNCMVNIRDHKSIRCANTGIASIHGAFIDARCHHTEESAQATSGQVLEPLVEKGLYGCAVGVRCESAAIVEIAGNDIRNCTTLGVNTATGATVSGKACDLSGCALAFEGYASATQAFPRLWAKDVGKLIEHHYACNFSSWTAHVSMSAASTQTRYIDIRDGGRCNLYDADIDANTGIIAQDGSELSITRSVLKINAVRSFYGSRVHLDTITWNQAYKNATSQLNISRGAFLNAQAITTSDGVALTSGSTKNTLSISGAVFAA